MTRGGDAVPTADHAGALLNGRRFTAEEVCGRPSVVPASSGVYAWWFDEIPGGVPTEGCADHEGWYLLYVGISPKRPTANGRPASRQTVRSRVRYHFRGNAEGSTLRLTLGVLLGLGLRRVGSGTRRTFAESEARLSKWMADHARVSVVEHPQPWLVETAMIGHLVLPLNLDQNSHPYRPTLSALRNAAKQRAGALPVVAR